MNTTTTPNTPNLTHEFHISQGEASFELRSKRSRNEMFIPDYIFVCEAGLRITKGRESIILTRNDLLELDQLRKAVA